MKDIIQRIVFEVELKRNLSKKGVTSSLVDSVISDHKNAINEEVIDRLKNRGIKLEDKC